MSNCENPRTSVKLLSETISAVRKGGLDAKTAQIVGFLAGVARAAMPAEQSQPSVQVEFIVHRPTGRIPCALCADRLRLILTADNATVAGIFRKPCLQVIQ